MKKFKNSEDGNIAVITAIVLLPLMAVGGIAIDFSQLSRKNTNLQGLVDAAALVGAKAALEDNVENGKKAAEEYLRANLPPQLAQELKGITVRFDEDNKQLSVSASSEYSTSILKMMGREKLEYSPFAQVGLPTGNLEVVLVLDTTFSMSADGKIEALQTAAKEFTDTMLDLNNGMERVKIGIVPFSNYVNVGLDNRNAPWLEVEDDSSETVTETRTTQVSTANCKDVQYQTDGVDQTGQSCDRIVTEVDPYDVTFTRTTTWNGCVGSRNFPLNLDDRNYNKKVPGLMNTSCPSRITQLTADADVLHTEIDNLTPNGSTYIPAGLAWGLRVISSQEPFSEGVTYADAKANDTQKVIVLMTDGENQSSAMLPDSPFHNGSDLKEADTWTNKACNKIKKQEISLYTIGFGKKITKDVRKLLRKCSTDKKQYLAAKSNADLSNSFEAIADDLASLYLSK